MKKKLTAIILAALMVVSFIPFTASAASDGYAHDAILDDSEYYHMSYVEAEDFFADDISLYTAVGAYDGAWKNYFTGETDIDYAKAILLGLIEKVDVESNSETYEEIIEVLKGASKVADVIEKVNEYTGIFDFAESTEWAQSITILNAAIKVANISKEMYDQYIRDYAAILSAKAASVYYSDLLTHLIENCTNSSVVAAASEVLDSINAEMDAAINEIYKKLAASAADGAAEAGIAAAMGSNTVTSIIYSVYTGGISAADKIFNTSSKYGYMCSLAEIYTIEDCLDEWAEAIFNGDDEALADFAASAFITIRLTGEELLASLANAKVTSLYNLVKKYDVTEIKVRTAVAAAKLEGIRYLLSADIANDIDAVLTATGKADVILQDVAGNLGNVIMIDDGVAVDFTETTYGVYGSVYNESLGEYIKVIYVFAGGDYDAYVCNGTGGNAYISLHAGDDTFYAAKTLADKRSLVVENVLTFSEVPTLTVCDAGLEEVPEAMTTEFVALKGEDNGNSGGGIISGGGSGSGGSSTSGGSSFGDIIKAFFQSIIDAFKSIFKIFG